MGRLTEQEIATRLRALAGWRLANGALVKLYNFQTFAEGIQFVDRVAVLADAADHHPDIDIRYTRVTMALTTHSAGGITDKDFTLAGQIDRAAST
ncbi:MAG TPA: 4a-hydroxytetrahydrobiopterin dehydratase [Nitrospiria bacterium]|nr:4a-hydroxytetrahydrobiopterin dehydratase [Nitrospiria bacterium]